MITTAGGAGACAGAAWCRGEYEAQAAGGDILASEIGVGGKSNIELGKVDQSHDLDGLYSKITLVNKICGV